MAAQDFIEFCFLVLIQLLNSGLFNSDSAVFLGLEPIWT